MCCTPAITSLAKIFYAFGYTWVIGLFLQHPRIRLRDLRGVYVHLNSSQVLEYEAGYCYVALWTLLKQGRWQDEAKCLTVSHQVHTCSFLPRSLYSPCMLITEKQVFLAVTSSTVLIKHHSGRWHKETKKFHVMFQLRLLAGTIGRPCHFRAIGTPEWNWYRIAALY